MISDRSLKALVDRIIRDVKRREAAAAELEREKFERRQRRHQKKVAA